MKLSKRIGMLFVIAVAGILLLIKQNLLNFRNRFTGKKSTK